MKYARIKVIKHKDEEIDWHEYWEWRLVCVVPDGDKREYYFERENSN